MNPFVNPKKRGVSLPMGCKDLIDVLNRPKSQHEDPAPTFIRLILMQAHANRATELFIGAALGPDCTIKEKIDGTTYHVSTFPSEFRSSVVKELGRMAAHCEIVSRLEGAELRWKLEMSSPEGNIVLMPLDGP